MTYEERMEAISKYDDKLMTEAEALVNEIKAHYESLAQIANTLYAAKRKGLKVNRYLGEESWCFDLSWDGKYWGFQSNTWNDGKPNENYRIGNDKGGEITKWNPNTRMYEEANPQAHWSGEHKALFISQLKELLDDIKEAEYEVYDDIDEQLGVKDGEE